MRRYDSLCRIFGFFLTFVGIVILLFDACISWLFRDGLGPDSVTSSGTLAVSRFMEGFWLYLCVAVLLCIIGGYLWVKPSGNQIESNIFHN